MRRRRRGWPVRRRPSPMRPPSRPRGAEPYTDPCSAVASRAQAAPNEPLEQHARAGAARPLRRATNACRAPPTPSDAAGGCRQAGARPCSRRHNGDELRLPPGERRVRERRVVAPVAVTEVQRRGVGRAAPTARRVPAKLPRAATRSTVGVARQQQVEQGIVAAGEPERAAAREHPARARSAVPPDDRSSAGADRRRRKRPGGTSSACTRAAVVGATPSRRASSRTLGTAAAGSELAARDVLRGACSTTSR